MNFDIIAVFMIRKNNTLIEKEGFTVNRRIMAFIDGENLVCRYQDMIKEKNVFVN